MRHKAYLLISCSASERSRETPRSLNASINSSMSMKPTQHQRSERFIHVHWQNTNLTVLKMTPLKSTNSCKKMNPSLLYLSCPRVLITKSSLNSMTWQFYYKDLHVSLICYQHPVVLTAITVLHICHQSLRRLCNLKLCRSGRSKSYIFTFCTIFHHTCAWKI